MKVLRKTIGLAILLAAMSLPAKAQIFTMENDQNGRDGTLTVDPNGDLSNVIVHNSTDDATNYDYVPMGSGLLLLTALGGAYALKKKTGK